MKRKIGFILGALAVLTACAFISCAQPADAGKAENGVTTVRASVSGIVTDPAGLPLKNVLIQYAAGNRSIHEIKTDSDGRYFIDNLASGKYTLTFNVTTTVSKVDTVYLGKKIDITVMNLSAYLPLINNTAATSPQLGSLELGEKDGYYALNDQNITLYPMTAAVKGIMMVQEKGGTQATAVVADSKVIRFNLGSSYIPSFLETTTDTTGAFSFANFPAGMSDLGGTSLSVVLGATAAAIGKSDLSEFEDKTVAVPAGASTKWATSVLPLDLGTLYAAPEMIALKLVSSNITIGSDDDNSITDFPLNGMIKLTFSKAVTSWGVVTFQKVSGSVNVPVAIAVDATDSKVLNITPVANLLPETQYKVQITDLSSGVAGDVSIDIDTFYFTTVVRPFDLVSSNTYVSFPASGAVDTTTFPIGSAINAGFSQTVTGWKTVTLATVAASTTYLPVSVTINALDPKILNILPTAPLLYGTPYVMVLTGVVSGVACDVPVTKTLNFTTVMGPTLATPVLVKNNAVKMVNNGGKTTYESGATSFYVTLTNYDANATYTFQYKAETDATWELATATAGAKTATSVEYVLTGATLVSGNILTFRVYAEKASAVLGYYSPSNKLATLSFTDETRPTFAAATFGVASTSLLATPIDSVSTQTSIYPDYTSVTDIIDIYTIALTGGEVMSLPTATGPLTGITVDFALAADKTSAKMFVRKPAGTAAVVLGTLVITVQDGAGYEVDFNTATAIVDKLSVIF